MRKRIFFVLAAWAILLVDSLHCTVPTFGQESPAPMSPLLSADERPLATFLANPTYENGRLDQRGWVAADYLFAFTGGARLPILASTSVPGTPRALAGVLNAPGSSTLFGGWQNDDLRAGFRLGAGYWFGGDSVFGMEAGFMFVGGQNSKFVGSSDQFPILARPYVDATDSTPQAVLVAFPGSSTGTLDIRASAGNFASANFDITEKALDEGWFRMTAMIGYRFYTYSDSLSIHQAIGVTDPNFVPGTTVVTNDSFSARNTFNGFDMGFRTRHAWQNWSLEFLLKMALGDLRRQVNINGNQTTNVPGAAPTFDQAGVLALASNSGTFINHDFKVMPEAGATLAWQLRPNVNVRLGYSFLLLNGIARAHDQIDTTLNPNFFPPASPGIGPNRPAFTLSRTDLWIQSLNLGLEWTY